MRLPLTILLATLALPCLAQSKYDWILREPPPKSEKQQEYECEYLRDEITKNRNYLIAARSLADVLTYRRAQILANRNISVLETRAASTGCPGAFNAQAPSSSAMTFDQCFAKCKELTKRDDAACFDSCKR